MNLIEILKDVPRDTKLYSPMFGDVFLVLALGDSISVHHGNPNYTHEFNKEGKYSEHGECMLFPSRENRDWNTFNIFRKGDILVAYGSGIFIYNGITNNELDTLGAICGINGLNRLVIKYISTDRWCSKKGTRKATDEEIKLLYDRLKEEGYTWNAHTLTLSLILNKVSKFDINKLKPFDKVLVRDNNYSNWRCCFFDSISELPGFKFRTAVSINAQCVPYNDETKHLVGTKEPCPEYYKNW